jgi:orotate phosphoribosyltransferase
LRASFACDPVPRAGNTSTKTYGTCRLAEGGEVAGRRLVIVEDVVTSAGQVIESCRRLREFGAVVTIAVCEIDREVGGAGNLAGESVELCSLFTISDLQRSTSD